MLSFAWPLRMLFVSRPQALSRCLAVITRAIQTDLAQSAGLKATDGARTGIVTLIQRYGTESGRRRLCRHIIGRPAR